MSYLITGLGNIGAEYANTRHNIGFTVLDAWAKASNISFMSGRYGSTAELRARGEKIILLKPSTYMNLSGKAVNYWLQQTKTPIEKSLVIVDDIALPFGSIRLRAKGSDGGHNGLKNIAEILGRTDYPRLRVGIGDNFRKNGQIDYVLGHWTGDEEKELPFIADECIKASEAFIAMGIEKAMNIFNTSKKKDEAVK